MPEMETEPLVNAEEGESYIVGRVKDQNPELLRYLEKIGLLPGIKVHIKEKGPFKGPLTLLIEDEKQVIGYDAGQLLVGNAIISKDMVDYDKLVPNEKEGEAIRPIVSDMIFAMPGSVRRKDTIDIYLVSNSLIGQYAKEESAASSSSSDKQKEAVANGATLKKP